MIYHADGNMIQVQANITSGNTKTFCPACHHLRKNKQDRSLSINITSGVFKCHNCGWHGVIDERKGGYFSAVEKTYNKPDHDPDGDISKPAQMFFVKRGISLDIVRRNKITADGKYIYFPYFRNGELINVKVRGINQKKFQWKDSGCEVFVFGYDDLVDSTVFIVEGEMDKLAMEEAGYMSVISCPSASVSSSGDIPWLNNAVEGLESATEIGIAVDNDDAGRKLETALIRRLGAERCNIVRFPDSKDANECLMKHGKEAVRKAVEEMKPVPVKGLCSPKDIYDQLVNLKVSGYQKALSPGWKQLSEHYRVMPGQMTILTGTPSSGKSEFLDALMINMINLHNWKFAVYSAENQPLEFHLAKLVEKNASANFYRQIDIGDLPYHVGILTDHLVFIHPSEANSLNKVLELARIAVRRYGINGLVIDPWNELEHEYQGSETQYISAALSRVRAFARENMVHVWIVAHPTKMRKDPDGKYPVPTPYDICGSSNWYNKADCALSIWRDRTNEATPVELHIQKIRFQRQCGKVGVVSFNYDSETGKYIALENNEEWEDLI